MNTYRTALCWAAAILAAAVAGLLGIIDEASATTLLVALPVAGWMAISGRGCCLAARKP